MNILSRAEIQESLASHEADSLFIDPMLDESQVRNVTVDLRLGYDFLVSILTRKPVVELHPSDPTGTHRPIRSFFQETRRDLGERFVVYPGQVVLGTTLEYVSLPTNMYGDVLSRSSYTRLGLAMNTMLQPGFRGCVPLELFNHGNNPVELIVGSRICQIRLFELGVGEEYLKESPDRKYFCSVRPSVSAADKDGEISRLNAISLMSDW